MSPRNVRKMKDLFGRNMVMEISQKNASKEEGELCYPYQMPNLNFESSNGGYRETSCAEWHVLWVTKGLFT
jgi:hypothetical protein